ncbi:ABC transporter permease [Pseudoduganella umbonata]|uniref:ABC transporter permease n=1 Tax=Pseudoduganella umbonata TaxID=864828 RepID=A0A4V1EDU1_9BURK|nr:ABC transporter permease [Pseudoduganella umbonata]MBB3225245.1 peptide/nickel transport system permease protein [Pseudoduganella umbonata]QCP12261.1 ABC transporter permease [Pseudoduganella umbonata]
MAHASSPAIAGPAETSAPASPPATARQAWPWLRWLGTRLLAGLGAVLAISVIVFGATQALPSDPARMVLGPEATEASVRTLQRQLGLDRPVPVQYLAWAGQLLQGDLGRSLDSHVPVAALVQARAANSLVLLGCVLAVLAPAAVAIGVALALRRDSALDRHAVALLIALKAIPNFALGIGLVMLFATTVWRVLPAVSLLEPGRSPWLQPQFLVLPAVTLVLAGLPHLARLVRSAMIEALDADYVQAARLRGVPERAVIWTHALPNALIPAIQGLALTLSVLLGGTLVVEVVFTYPGLGSALNAAIEMRDLPVIQAIVLLVAGGVVLINLAADLLTVLLTPRLRTAVAGGA